MYDLFSLISDEIGFWNNGLKEVGCSISDHIEEVQTQCDSTSINLKYYHFSMFDQIINTYTLKATPQVLINLQKYLYFVETHNLLLVAN